MKSEKLFRAIGQVSEDKINKAEEISKDKADEKLRNQISNTIDKNVKTTSKISNWKALTSVAACLILIIGGLFRYSSLITSDINKDEDGNVNSAKVTKDFVPYGQGEFAIGVYFYLDGYSYSLISEASEVSWNIDINGGEEVCGDYLGEIQYGDYQAYRQSAGEEYKIYYGVYDKNDRVREGVYDKDKGKTFSSNKNIVGGKVYQSTIADYILVVELNGKYALFVGNIVTESDYPFRNAFDFYGIKSGNDIDKVEVTVYDWKNGHGRIDENIVSIKNITEVNDLQGFYEIVSGLKADRDNGEAFVLTRIAYWEEQGEKKTKSATIEFYLKSGYKIEFDYRQQYPYLLAFEDAIKVEEKYVHRFHDILGIE